MHRIFWLIPLLPFLGFLFHGLLGRRAGKTAVTAVAIGTVSLSLLLSLAALLAVKGAGRLEVTGFEWMAAGDLKVPFGLVLDPLSVTMALVVTGIGTLIHVYSASYMSHDGGYARYFAYLNLFVFFMLTLVLGSSLPLLFVGWEGVGLCSYLLIGFDSGTETASAAGLKAFLANRVGDLGMIIGMMVLFAHFGTLTIGDLLLRCGALAPEAAFGVLSFATLMMFVGATGKSAQIPLYLWLPDAMAGPTPVSALIHAATMVTAGIFLVCRLGPLFLLAPATLTVIAWTGAATALFAATIGLFQRDIKKVLAYSTVSQLGYMFLGLGAGAALGAEGFSAGFFHVFTHAWFKALLFLGAGSVIHALHQQDLFRMGGLKGRMPVTYWTMLVATLCIIGFPGTSGFASKDEILHLAFLKSPWLWGMGVLGACCTAFYMVRLLVLAFHGEPRDAEAHAHAHESPLAMTVPLAILAAGALLSVILGWPEAFGGSWRIGHWLAPSLSYGRAAAEALPEGGHGLPRILAAVSTTLALASAAFAWSTYRNGTEVAEARAARWPTLHRVVLHKYYVDEAVEAFLLRPIRNLATLLWTFADTLLIDGLGVNFPGALTGVAGDLAVLSQTGRVRNYALCMALGALFLFWIFLK